MSPCVSKLLQYDKSDMYRFALCLTRQGLPVFKLNLVGGEEETQLNFGRPVPVVLSFIPCIH